MWIPFSFCKFLWLHYWEKESEDGLPHPKNNSKWWPKPTTLKQLQRFRDYSWVAAPPLSLPLCRSHSPGSPEADLAFVKLKKYLPFVPILVQPDPTRQFIVEVGASNTGVGQSSPSTPSQNKSSILVLISLAIYPLQSIIMMLGTRTCLLWNPCCSGDIQCK